MDLLSIVPYYCGYLCSGFGQVEGIELALGSIRYGHDPSFFRRMGLHNDPGLLDVAWRVPDSAHVLRRALKLLECLLNLAGLTVRFLAAKPDIIHVQFIPLVQHGLHFEHWFLRLARARGVKIVYTVHNVLPHNRSKNDEALYRRIYSLVDRFVCHDASAKDRLVEEFRISPERIDVVPHGPLFGSRREVDKGEARARVGLPNDGYVVLCQGIIRPYKGIPFLLAAWKKAKEAGLQGTLAVVGTGDEPLLEEIKHEVSRLNLNSSVRLVFRFVSVDELDAFYQAADTLAYPYSSITTSGALMTGIGYSKAIVASDLKAFQELLSDRENALLVRYGNVEALAAAMVELQQNTELRLRLAERLQETQKQLPSWTDIARQTLLCYRTALSCDGNRFEPKSKELQ
jgi:glycosyltransferase involved in cell wall biosynthesis